MSATEGLLEEAKASILNTVCSVASGLEDELKGYLALERDACIQELVVESNNVVRNAVSRVRTETEEIVQAGCARISNQLESTAVACANADSSSRQTQKRKLKKAPKPSGSK